VFRIVVDTNIRFSAAMHNGVIADLLPLLVPPGFIMFVSDAMLDELVDLMGRKSNLSSSEIFELRAHAVRTGILVHPRTSISVCRDADDNHVLECAVEAEADFILTGDKDLLALHPFRGISILTARQFIDQHFT
jgi:putative PIN family toxin of toxin-antitoxin system